MESEEQKETEQIVPVVLSYKTIKQGMESSDIDFFFLNFEWFGWNNYK